MRFGGVIGGRERVSLVFSHRFNNRLEKQGNAGLVRRLFDMKHSIEVMYGEVWF